MSKLPVIRPPTGTSRKNGRPHNTLVLNWEIWKKKVLQFLRPVSLKRPQLPDANGFHRGCNFSVFLRFHWADGPFIPWPRPFFDETNEQWERPTLGSPSEQKRGGSCSRSFHWAAAPCVERHLSHLAATPLFHEKCHQKFTLNSHWRPSHSFSAVLFSTTAIWCSFA